MAAEGRAPDADLVDYIHRHKTGDLIRASVRIGAIAAGAGPAHLDALTRYAEAAGLVFQVADDVLNATASAHTLGKGAGTDQQRGKVTYVAVHGLAGAQMRAQRLLQEALDALAAFGPEAEPLRALAAYVVSRER
jgi:geranylgeranyl diphosphate synthase type II